jgi:molybdenum cofactor biosynthesis enzyme MoaA
MRNPGINKFLTLEQLHEAISIAKEKGYNTVMFTGGEPTLHPQFMEVMKTTYESGLAVKVITNYTRPEVLKKAEEYIDRIHISYYKQQKLPKFGEFKHADLYMLCMVSKTNFPTLRTFLINVK